MAVSRIAFLGLGRMGAPMAAKLVAAGHQVTTFNRGEAGHRRLADELSREAGIGGSARTSRRAADPAAAVAGAQIVVTMLADARALEQVLFGERGAAGALPADAVVCDMSTIGVSSALACHARLAAAGTEFVDAPVSGSVAAVRGGALLVMAGGGAEAIARVEPALRAFAGSVVHVGPAGGGQAMKLAVNSVVHTLNAAVSEALVLAERAGIARGLAFEVFTNSAVAAPFLRYKRASFEEPDCQPVAFTIDLMRKDLGLIEELAENLLVPVPVVHAVREVADAASREGLGERDMSAVAVHCRSTAG